MDPTLINGAAGVGIGIGMVLLFAFLLFAFAALFLMAGAALAGIANRSFGKALIATVLAFFIGGIAGGVASFVHPLLGAVVQLLVAALMVKVIYGCGFFRAFAAYLLSIVVSIVLVLAIAFALGSGAALLEQAKGKGAAIEAPLR